MERFKDLACKPSDIGRRRFVAFTMEFDTRAAVLSVPIEDDWDDKIKDQWFKNKSLIVEGLIKQYGEYYSDQKIKNFISIDSKPMSIIAYHNRFYSDIRNSFVVGSYYSSLVGACALGERLLNHLIIDLRDNFKNTDEFKSVRRKDSFQNWIQSIEILKKWDIISDSVALDFQELMNVRHRSIHFNIETYASVRDDALFAILKLRDIIKYQFGTFNNARWFIPGTKGACFVKKEYENHPFVKHYFQGIFPFVGIYYSLSFKDGKVNFYDIPDYGTGSLTDDEFVDQFNNRDPQLVAKAPD